MKVYVLIIMASFALSLIPYRVVLSASQTKYSIQIGDDGSATWVVSQTLDVNASLDTLEEFQNKVTLLVEASRSITGRDMAASANSLVFTASGSYIDVERTFYWENFSKTEDMHIVIGDVFQVPNFFLELYGDGEVYMTYPPQYVVEEKVLPTPSTRNDSIQSLVWLGTVDFDSETRIDLTEKSATSGFIDTLEQNAMIIVALTVVIAGSSAGLYAFRHRGKKEITASETPEFPNLPGIQDDEKKTVKLIKSFGGSLHQSAITNQCGFSKAKTSQLLAVMEHKGIVRRYKKGRDKIVVLMEQDESGTK
jgi:uncharacterized membrane protein